MNYDENQKSKSPASDDNSSSAGPQSSHSDLAKGETQEAKNPRERPSNDNHINLNDFLDLLKVSCHVNDMITQTDARNVSKIDVNFAKLAENRLVNELLGHKMNQQQQTNLKDQRAEPVESATCSIAGQSERHSVGRRSSIGLSIGSFSRRSTKRSDEYNTRAENSSRLHPQLDEKLDQVIKEGMLDSVLSFVCPVPLPGPFTGRSKAKQKEASGKSTVASGDGSCTTGFTDGDLEVGVGPCRMDSGVNTSKDQMKLARRKSLFGSKEKKELEVVIHVCDEMKNVTRDFTCPQKLLVSKMGYFADVTAGQKLEEMDISVHCDIQIFDWLMKWMKHTEQVESSNAVKPTMEENASGPQLDASNVVPILVSASFLQMEPLLLDCLSFCHGRLSEVVRSSTNVSCLNDCIVARLAAMFTNLELEMVRDKKERLLPRLWIKLIQSLCEPEPEALRGHYYSLSGLFRCSKCGQCLTNTIKSRINCMASNMRLNRWGQLVSYHIPDQTWSINVFISQLFKELKSWRKVYWKLWGHCHFLYCCICEMHFPVYQMAWCRYHGTSANFLGPVNEGCIAGPAGRYPCCGQQAFRFETLPGPNGCQFREHSVLVETDRERSILQLVQVAGEGNVLSEPPPAKLQDMPATGLEPHWMGLPLTPQRCRQGLLPILNPDESSAKIARRVRQIGTASFFAESSSDTDTSDTLEDVPQSKKSTTGTASRDFYSSSDGCESEYSGPKVMYTKKGKKRHTENLGRYWSGELSARSNQDHQREFEEKVMKQVSAIVNKKTGSDHSLAQNVMPIGGSYIKLETEWKDQLKQRNTTNTNNNSNTSGSSTGLLTKQPKNK